MSVLDRLVDNSQHDRPVDDDTVVDLTDDASAGGVVAGPRHDRRVPVKGMRIRRVRLRSVAKIASVFWVLGYAVSVGTIVVLWNVAQSLGFVDTLEETVTTSLGLDEQFTLVGADLFRVAVVGLGFLFAFGYLLTVLLALVYNVTCSVFGGLALETGPLRRRHRVFSLRHRGFVTLRS